MLFQAFNKKLEFPKPSTVVNQTYVDFLAKTYRLSHNGHHGLEHWLRVLLNGRILAEENDAGHSFTIPKHLEEHPEKTGTSKNNRIPRELSSATTLTEPSRPGYRRGQKEQRGIHERKENTGGRLPSI